ncbi:MAG: hypothetical protein P4L56_02665 [Candidatus Sulfopaludibacter sp.]|nr:hypothetical protein [Candidatus Sulfopaludibacter sp.]
MRLNSYLYLRFLAAALTMLSVCAGAVLDRVAIVIDKQVITESELLGDLRLTEFINGQPLDLGPLARRDAAEHLVDQELIRRDMESGGFAKPNAAQGDALLRKFRQEHYPAPAAYLAALQKYGVTEEQLKQRLLWQLTAIEFTDLRFRPVQQEEPSQSADRAVTDGAAGSVDQQMDAWLKQARSNAKIILKPEAFQ